MPAPIIKGFVEYLAADAQLGIPVWDGEIPRQDATGAQITIPGMFPAFRVTMTEGGLARTWTQEDPYGDEGPIVFDILDTTREAVQDLLNQLEGLICNSSNWPLIELPGGPEDNPYYVYGVLWKTWTNVQIENVRTAASEYIYHGQVICAVGIHGAVTTR